MGNDYERAMDLCNYAWTIICNAGGGNWELESEDWREAAARFRDLYHSELNLIYSMAESMEMEVRVPPRRPTQDTHPL